MTPAMHHARKIEGLKRDLTLGPKPLPVETLVAAARAVGRRSADAEARQELLEMLGLLVVAS